MWYDTPTQFPLHLLLYGKWLFHYRISSIYFVAYQRSWLFSLLRIIMQRAVTIIRLWFVFCCIFSRKSRYQYSVNSKIDGYIIKATDWFFFQNYRLLRSQMRQKGCFHSKDDLIKVELCPVLHVFAQLRSVQRIIWITLMCHQSWER